MPLLGPPGLGHDPVDQLGRVGAGQHPDRDLVRQPLGHRRLDLPCSWHPYLLGGRHDTGKISLSYRH
jgi:hypothetical protein